MLDKEFPKESTLHKIFNRNTIKLSYSCMPNISNIISRHNKEILRTPTDANPKHCNCRNRVNCPLRGECLTENIVYQATATSQGSKETYIGLTSTQFKLRYNNHSATFRNSAKRNTTELSKHIWNLKDKNIEYTINWKIISKAIAS